jgi:integrase
MTPEFFDFHTATSLLAWPDHDLEEAAGSTGGQTAGSTAGKTASGSVASLTRAALHTIVKKVFAAAADRLRARGDEFASRADLVGQASAHWLRHTAGSHTADQQVDLRLVRDNLGHASLSATSLYLHVDDDRRHHETDEKHRIGW